MTAWCPHSLTRHRLQGTWSVVLGMQSSTCELLSRAGGLCWSIRHCLGAEEASNDMQMGGTAPRMDRRAEGMLQIPSPQISPDATATA